MFSFIPVLGREINEEKGNQRQRRRESGEEWGKRIDSNAKALTVATFEYHRYGQTRCFKS